MLRLPESGAVSQSIRRSPSRPASRFAWCSISRCVKPKACWDRLPTCSGQYRHPGSHDAQPSRRRPDDFAEAGRPRQIAASPCRQHRPQDLWRGRVAGSETWNPIAPPLAQACMGRSVSSGHWHYSLSSSRVVSARAHRDKENDDQRRAHRISQPDPRKRADDSRSLIRYSQRLSHSACIACSKETLLTVHSCNRALRLGARLLALTPK
jgi:hypothetical protein